MGTSDFLCDFNHSLQSPPVLGHACPKPVCDDYSQDAFFCSSVDGFKSRLKTHLFNLAFN